MTSDSCMNQCMALHSIRCDFIIVLAYILHTTLCVDLILWFVSYLKLDHNNVPWAEECDYYEALERYGNGNDQICSPSSLPVHKDFAFRPLSLTHTHNARTKQSLVLVDLQLQTQNNRRFSKIARSFLSNALIICAHWNDNNDYVTRELRCYCLPSQLFSSLPNWIRRNSLSSAFSVQHARLQWIKAVLLARLFLLFLQLSFTNFQFT